MPFIAGSALFGAKLGLDFAGGKKANKIQKKAADEQSAEIARQKKIQENKQREENLRLSNTISNLTNTSYGTAPMGGVGYTDLG